MEKYPVGYVIDDFKIIAKNNKKIVVQCIKCGRTQELSCINAFTKRINIHGNICSKIIIKQHGGKDGELKQFYSIWSNMRNRTTNQNYEKWHRYGGRGINSDEFKYFVDFYDSMYNSYKKHIEEFGEKNTTIERINSNGNYCTDNCAWATWNEQAKNKDYILDFIAINPNGKIIKGHNLKEFCENNNLNYAVIIGGLHQGNKSWRSGWYFEKV